MSTYIAQATRRFVIERAQNCCEYCGKSSLSFVPHEVDHIIAEKHGGDTTADNLAYACFECNRYKGSDIASFDPETEVLSLLFNPRKDRWVDHFRYEGGAIFPLTNVGRATVKLLRLNAHSRIQERITLDVDL